MPEVVFYALSGRSIEQKRALIKDFTEAVVKNYKVDASAVTITIVEFSQGGQGKRRYPLQRHAGGGAKAVTAELPGCAETAGAWLPLWWRRSAVDARQGCRASSKFTFCSP